MPQVLRSNAEEPSTCVLGSSVSISCPEPMPPFFLERGEALAEGDLHQIYCG